jgi:hypothetical protein
MRAVIRAASVATFLLLQALALAAFAQPAGRVDFAAGIVRIERGTQTLVAVRGTQVLPGDVIVTGPDTQVQIRMTDDAFLALRPNSRLTLEKYAFQRGDEDGVLLSLAHGVLRAFTGAIAARDRAKFVMKTPLATVGIRGSGNILAHLGEEGTVNHTISGAHSVTARTAAGELVTVISRPGQTVQVRPGAAPRFVPTPSFIFAAASSAPPAQVAATSSSTTSGGGASGSGSGSSSSSSSAASSASSSASPSESASSTSPSTTSVSTPSTEPAASPGVVTGSTTSPSSNVQVSVAPTNVRTPGTPGGGTGNGSSPSVGLIGNLTNPNGPRTPMFATDLDPGYSTVTTNASGGIASADNLHYSYPPGVGPTPSFPGNTLTDATVHITGPETDHFRNVEGNITMGRFQNASIDVTGAIECDCGETETRTDITAPGALAYVMYNETPRGVVLSYTGTTDFRLDGATRPADSHGNLGTLNTATMRANFTDRVLDFTFNLSVNSLTYTATASNVSFDAVRFHAGNDGSPNPSLLVTCAGAGCASSYYAAVNGSFAGNGTNAWMGYHIFPADQSDLVNGAIAFVANTVPSPRFTLPATGTWNMVLIDNYIATGPGFPTFTTAANAHINFTTQRADFTFNFDRVLTPADVSAGFQAQHITASASDLPMQGVGFVAQTASGTRPSTLNVTCTGCSATAQPVGRFEGYLSYVAPNPNEGGNVNIYWYLTNNTSGTLGYDYNGSSYFGNAPTPRLAMPTVAPPVIASPAQLARMPEAIRGPLRPPR